MRGNHAGRPDIKLYFLYACCMPFLFVLISVLVLCTTETWPYVSAHACWLAPGSTLIYLFATPISGMICINLVCFVFIVYKFKKVRSETESATQRASHKRDFFIYLRLLSIMGLSWLFGFIANIPGFAWCSYIFVMVNSLQGAFIYFAFGLSATVRQMWCQKCKRSDSQSQQSHPTTPVNNATANSHVATANSHV